MKKRVLTFLNNPERKLDFYDVLTLFGFTLVLFIGVLLLFTLNNILNLI